MGNKTVRSLIGLRIEEMRFHYQGENEYDLQEFYSYFKLSNGQIIMLPIYPDESFAEKGSENGGRLKNRFQEGQTFSRYAKPE